MAERPQLARRADYVAFVPISTRWHDNDVYGHINNVIYYSYFDTAVNQLLVEAHVLDGAADLGLVEGRTESDILRRVKVDVDRLMLVVAGAHPPIPELAPGRPDIKDLRWIIREGGSGTREVLEDMARRDGISLSDLRIFLVLPSNEAVRQAVEAGTGATIISELVVARAIAEGSLRSVPIDLPQRDFAVISHRDRQPSLAQLALRAHLGAGAEALPSA